MRSLIVVVVAVAATISTLAQIPVPSALIEARTIFLDGQAVERKWLETAAREFQKQRRFELVADPESADLVVVLSEGSGDTFTTPVFGGFISKSADRMNLTALDPSGRVLWSNTRQNNWLKSRTVNDLVKDLHKVLTEADAADAAEACGEAAPPNHPGAHCTLPRGHETAHEAPIGPGRTVKWGLK